MSHCHRVQDEIAVRLASTNELGESSRDINVTHVYNKHRIQQRRCRNIFP